MSYQAVLNKIPKNKDYTRSKYLDRDEEAFFKYNQTSKNKKAKK